MGIPPGDDIEYQGSILHVFRHRPHLVQRGSESDDPVPGYPSVAGSQPHYAAKRRGLPDAAAGIRPKGSDCGVSGQGRCAPAAGTAGHAAQVPWIVRGEKSRVLRGPPHGKLVQVRLADEDCPCLLQPSVGGGIVGRNVVLQDSGRSGRPDTSGADYVL